MAAPLAPLLALLCALPSAAQDLPHVKFHRAEAAPAAADAGSSGGACARDFDAAAPPLIDAQAPAAMDVSGKTQSRDFPSVFEAWQPAEGMSQPQSLALHDLAWIGVGGDVAQRNSKWAGLATAYTPTPTGQALRAANPNGILLAEIRWRDAWFEDAPGQPWKDYLPKGHPWWGKEGSDDATSSLDPANTTVSRPMYFLKHQDPCFQDQVARQCKAAIATGLFDGCMLDWWHSPDAAQLQLLKKVRDAIGPDALLIVNANGSIPTESMAYINGVFGEGFGAQFWPGGQGYADVPYPGPEAWRWLIQDLQALKGVRRPQINAIEAWGPVDDKRYMRAFTTAVLAYSDAYVLYSRPNRHGGDGRPAADHDHMHVFEDFWAKGLGRPLSEDPPTPIGGGAVRREFEHGTVVFNPSPAPVTVSFEGPRTSRATRAQGSVQSVPAGDGDIFLK